MLQDIICKTTLSSPEVKALYERFRRLAPCGWMGLDQFKVSMGVLGLTDDPFIAERMFEVFDSNGDGQLCFGEFSTSLAVMLRGTEDQKLKLSFDMVAGRKNRITKGDFKRLVNACNAVMASLAVPQDGLTREDEVEPFFEELAASWGELQDGEQVLTLEGYKMAAQTNEDFLACLGLHFLGRRGGSKNNTGGNNQRLSPVLSPAAPMVPESHDSAQAHTTVPTETLEELQQRVEMLSSIVRDARLIGPDASARGDAQLKGGRHERAQYSESQPTADTEEPSDAPTLDSLPNMQWLKPGEGAQPEGAVYGATKVAQSFFGSLFAGCRPCIVNDVYETVEPNGADGIYEVQNLASKLDDGDVVKEDLILPAPRVQPAKTSMLDRVGAELDGILGLCHMCHEKGPALKGRDRPTGLTGLVTAVGVGPSPTTPKAAYQQHGGNQNRSPRFSQVHGKRRLPTLHHQKHRLMGPKRGMAVHFGHENWNMVVSMMIGIRLSIGRARGEQRREMQPVDFTMKEKFTIAPNTANIFDSTASKRVDKYRFIDYAPMVFQRIRQKFGIRPDEYLRSVGPEQLVGNMLLGNLSSLSEQTSEGKSGAFFYYTADGKYMLKTVTKAEYHTLRRMLKGYYDHLRSNPQTLLVRFLGLHCLSVMEHLRGTESVSHSTQKMYFVVMANMFNTSVDIHRKYDLKGSWVGRSTDAEKRDNAVLKDVDFKASNERLLVGSEAAQQLTTQLEVDTQFLCENQVIDYSLLVGIHDVDLAGGSTTDIGENRILVRHPSTDSVDMVDSQQSTEYLPLHQRHLGGMLSSDRKSVFFFGVIDMFKTYDAKAKLEHHAKALVYDRQGVSCCNPELYRARFNSFMNAVIV